MATKSKGLQKCLYSNGKKKACEKQKPIKRRKHNGKRRCIKIKTPCDEVLKNLQKGFQVPKNVAFLEDSRNDAIRTMEAILAPVKLKTFVEEYWGKKPLLIKRNCKHFYKDWFSCDDLEKILRNFELEFTQNVDITSYVNGVKKNHNPEGRAYAPIVWDFFQQGCSVRLLNPQTYSKNIWKYLSILQEYFHSSVGANIYLTPANCQGFAPHYDDIDAFALQLEGKKHWRVYNPRNENEYYPIFSSGNFGQNEIGKPIIDCVLEEGDLLYFPRGFIHQANSCADIHSLHITVSTFQKTTFGDFMTQVLSAGCAIAIEEDKEFRKNLPIGYLELGGLSFSKENAVKRKKFMEKIIELGKKVIDNYLPIDAALDQFGKTFLQDSLPPFLHNSEKKRSIHGSGEKWDSLKNEVRGVSEIEPNSQIKLIRKNSIRVVEEGSSIFLYYNIENSRLFQDKEIKYLEIEKEAASAVLYLIRSYPNYISVDTLPLEDIEQKIMVASNLYDRGLLITKEKLSYAFESEESD